MTTELTAKEFIAQYNNIVSGILGSVRKLPTEKHVNGEIAYLKSMTGKIERAEETASRLQELSTKYPKNSTAPKSKYYDNQK